MKIFQQILAGILGLTVMVAAFHIPHWFGFVIFMLGICILNCIDDL